MCWYCEYRKCIGCPQVVSVQVAAVTTDVAALRVPALGGTVGYGNQTAGSAELRM